MAKAAPNKVVLTDKLLRSLKPDPAAKRRMIWDAGQPNFGVRVGETGRRSFIVVRRPAGSTKPSWHVVGTYPEIGLSAAREQARDVRSLLGKGTTPKLVEQARLREQQERQRLEQVQQENTFASVAEKFIRKHLVQLRSGRRHESLVRSTLLPAFGTMQVGDIKRKDIIRLVEGIAETRGPAAARLVFAIISKFYNWCLNRDIEGVEYNPAARLSVTDLVGAPTARDRILSDAELKLVWQAIETLGYPFEHVFKLLILLGQRRDEITCCRWSELDFDNATLTIPATRMKGHLVHTVPLPSMALEIFRTVPRFTGEFAFSRSGGQRAVSGIAAVKARLDGIVAQTAQIPHWTTHDLRRTCRSNLAALGVPPVVAEAVIGHRQRGILQVYDRHSYSSEKRDALTLWQEKLISIVAG